MSTVTKAKGFKLVRGVLRYTASDGSKWIATIANPERGYCSAVCETKGYEHMKPEAIGLEAMIGGIETGIYL